MTMKWFGKRTLEFQEPEDEVPTPVGERCSWCRTPIAEDDDGVVIPHADLADSTKMSGRTVVRTRMQPHHLECHLRTIFGSVEHQEKRCTCYGGDAAEPHTREAARQAVALFSKSRRES